MNVHMEPVYPVVDWTTSGIEEPRQVGSYITLWSCTGTSGSCAFAEDLPERLYYSTVGTNAGITRRVDPMPLQAAIVEIRSRSHLTWDQLAAVFNVNRRSLHFWARGARPSSDNAERIGRVLGIVRQFDRGEPERTREALFEPSVTGESVFQLLCENRDTEVMRPPVSRADEPTPRVQRRPPSLSASTRRERSGFSPLELLDALHDTGPQLGRFLGAVPVPGLRA